jgi:hypothetical protein
MPLYRFLHPVAFLCFLQVGLAIARLAESRSRAAILLPLAAAGLVLSSSIALYAEMVRMNLVRASVAAPDRHERDLLATYLNGGLPAGESVAVLAAGYLPSQLSAPVIDMLGLHSRTIATSGQTGRAFPGHRRFNTDYVLARRPAVICDLKIFTPAFSVPAAEALKHSSEFARLYRSVEVCVPDGTGWAKLSFHLRRDLAIPRGGFDSGGLGCVRAFENMKARGVPVEELVQPSDSTLASSGSSTARSRSSPSERPFK